MGIPFERNRYSHGTEEKRDKMSGGRIDHGEATHRHATSIAKVTLDADHRTAVSRLPSKGPILNNQTGVFRHELVADLLL
jgi:hypothetical protein